jgi:hypothetical protein
MEPPRVPWPERSRGLLPPLTEMAGAMIPPDILNDKSLFSLLYKIDQDLAERTRVQGCPSAGVHCTAPTTCVSLEVGPGIWKRHLRLVSVCAAGTTAAVAGFCHHRFGSGAAGSTGLPCYCWLAPFGKATRFTPLSDSRRFAGCGDLPSTVGRNTSGISLPRASATGVCSVT